MNGPTHIVLAEVSHHVSPALTAVFAAILVLMIAALALEEKIHAKKSLITGLFAAVSLFLGAVFDILPSQDALDAVGLHVPVYIPPINWEVIAIILGSSLFVDVTSKTGLFTWVAIKLTKHSGGDPVKLLVYYGLMTVVFSAVLNNVTAMIIIGSLTSVSLKKLGREKQLLGFLLVEGLLTNVGGLLTLISSVPNIIIGNTAGISFIDFFLVAAPYVVIATLVTLVMGTKIFKIERLKTGDERDEARLLIESFDERDGIESRAFFWFGAVMSFLFIATLATTSVLPFVRDLGMGYVALTFAAVMLIRYRSSVDKFYQAMDWDLLAFFASLFVVIHVMECAEVLALIGRGLSAVIALGDLAGSSVLLVVTALFSSVTDNIPLSDIMAKILVGIEGIGDNSNSPFWWSVVFGANLGGNITPIGSASTLVAVTIIHRNKIKFSFVDFVKAALPFALAHIVLGTLYVVVFLT